MTIREAAAQGIARVRLPQWASPVCYLKIDLIKAGGGIGPWAHLFDRQTQQAIGAETPQTLPLWSGLDDDGYEPYAGDKDSADDR